MDKQDPPNPPCYQFTMGLNRFRQRKRCCDVTPSRQEGSMMRHLANAQYWTGQAGGNTGCLFPKFGGPVCANWFSNCPLDRVLTYKNLIAPTPLAGGRIIFTFSGVRRPSSHLVTGHFKEKYLSYLYHIWYWCLLG